MLFVYEESTRSPVTRALTEVILLKMNDGKVTEYVNGELELEEVERFDIDLNERKLDNRITLSES